MFQQTHPKDRTLTLGCYLSADVNKYVLPVFDSGCGGLHSILPGGVAHTEFGAFRKLFEHGVICTEDDLGHGAICGNFWIEKLF